MVPRLLGFARAEITPVDGPASAADTRSITSMTVSCEGAHLMPRYIGWLIAFALLLPPRLAAQQKETVTVTQQVPIVNTTSAQVTGNIDRRQMAELPLQGRNWQELALMVKGITANNITNTPGVADDQYQLNLDGQQITQRVASSGFG